MVDDITIKPGEEVAPSTQALAQMFAIMQNDAHYRDAGISQRLRDLETVVVAPRRPGITALLYPLLAGVLAGGVTALLLAFALGVVH